MTMKPLHVMIVDDEAPARARLRDLLADIDDEVPNRVVAEAANGIAAIEALEMLADKQVDVVLADIRMPKMGGVELARHLAQLHVQPAVIFVTAYDSYAVEAFELSAVDYLVKPVRAVRLRQHDIDFQYLVVALLLQRDLDVVGIDRDIFRDHGNQILLQSREKIRLAGQAIALVGNDQLQALLGDGGGFRLVTEDERKQGHAYFPPNSRLSRPGFS